jgi:hypothetical protein
VQHEVNGRSQRTEVSLMCYAIGFDASDVICRYPVNIGREIKFYVPASIQFCLKASPPLNSVKDAQEDIELIR